MGTPKATQLMLTVSTNSVAKQNRQAILTIKN